MRLVNRASVSGMAAAGIAASVLLAAAPQGAGVYFVDDATNQLDLLR